jgi:cyanate lyase
MLVSVTRNEITEQIVVARLAKGLTWQQLADAIDRPVVWDHVGSARPASDPA